MLKRLNIFAIGFYFVLWLCLFPAQGLCAIKIKLLAINPSETSKQKIPIRYELPKEISKEDILDSGTMNVEYDIKNGVYYVTKEIELEPKSSVTFQVIIADKWNIPAEKIEDLGKKLDERLKTLENTDKYETAKLLTAKMQAKLEEIVNSQETAGADIQKKMEIQRVNNQLLEQFENDVHSLEYLSGVAKSEEEAGTLKFVIEANNPSSEPMETKITHYLPKEITPDTIVNTSGFNAGYDREKQQYFLWKEEKFKAGEKKRYEIEVKDVWRFSNELLDVYQKDAETILQKLETTKYAAIASTIYNGVTKDISDIQTSQNEASTLKDRVSRYADNLERSERVKENLNRLKIMLGDIAKETSLKPSEESVKNVLREIKALHKLKILSDKLVKKIVPKTQIWKIVLDVVLFAIFFTIVVTAILAMRLKSEDARKYKKVEKTESEKVK